VGNVLGGDQEGRPQTRNDRLKKNNYEGKEGSRLFRSEKRAGPETPKKKKPEVCEKIKRTPGTGPERKEGSHSDSCKPESRLAIRNGPSPATTPGVGRGSFEKTEKRGLLRDLCIRPELSDGAYLCKCQNLWRTRGTNLTCHTREKGREWDSQLNREGPVARGGTGDVIMS